ncbi:MAG: hypothetical protein AAGJ73_13305 [Pseudomonadota bacterium]
MRNHQVGTRLDDPTYDRFLERAKHFTNKSDVVLAALEQYLAPPSLDLHGEITPSSAVDFSDIRVGLKACSDSRAASAKRTLRLEKLLEQLITQVAKNGLISTEILRHLSPDALNALEKDFEAFARLKGQSNNGAGRVEAPVKNGQKGAEKPDQKTAGPADIHAHDTLETDEELAR